MLQTKGKIPGLLCRVMVVNWVLSRGGESARPLFNLSLCKGADRKSQLDDQGNGTKRVDGDRGHVTVMCRIKCSQIKYVSKTSGLAYGLDLGIKKWGEGD